MKNEFVRINIAFKPPSEVARMVESLSREISQKEETFFTLDSKHFYPHMTIYFLECPVCNREKVLEKIENLAKSFAPVEFVATQIETSHGYIGMGADYSSEIRRIHETIIKETNPLRENHLREKYVTAIHEKIPADKWKNIQQYGHPDILDLYKPHITITRLRDEKMTGKIVEGIAWSTKNFTLDTIGVYLTGEHGTCVELIGEFKLKD